MLARVLFLSRTHRSRSPLFSTAPSLNKDPWPLPNTPEHLASTTTTTTPQDDARLPTRLPRIDESLPALRARLVYQSRKRGTLESDLLLSTFARENLDSMSVEELREYDYVRHTHFLSHTRACAHVAFSLTITPLATRPSLTHSFLSFSKRAHNAASGRTRLGHLLLVDRKAARSGSLGILRRPRQTRHARQKRGQSRPQHACAPVGRTLGVHCADENLRQRFDTLHGWTADPKKKSMIKTFF